MLILYDISLSCNFLVRNGGDLCSFLLNWFKFKQTMCCSSSTIKPGKMFLFIVEKDFYSSFVNKGSTCLPILMERPSIFMFFLCLYIFQSSYLFPHHKPHSGCMQEVELLLGIHTSDHCS